MPGKAGQKNLTNEQVEAIVRGRRAGMKQHQLADQFRVKRCTITKVLKRVKERGTVEKPKRSGRPRITSKFVDKSLVKMSRKNPRMTSVDISREIATYYGVKASPSTIKRRLLDAGLHGRRPARKPLVSAKNKSIRLQWAKKYRKWPKTNWDRVIWSDESRFFLFGNDSRGFVRRPSGTRFDPQYQVATVKHGGGSIMVWGCFTRNGVGPLVRIEGNMDRFMYRDILEKHMLPWAKCKFGSRFIFQQDNDRKHTSQYVKDWFKQKKVTVLEWPSQSPDANPIEHLWDHLERTVAHVRATSADERFRQLEAAWTSIPQSVLDKLVDSMEHRLDAIIATRGFPTPY